MAEERTADQEFGLVTILNIMWRRRLIVLGLRWSATATVRPGITAYTPEGFPLRQWQLKDITTWFDKMLYQRELAKRLGMERDFKPVVQTEFIATGLTNLAGGEVVTLWTTGTSPEMARAIIDTSIAIFRDYAEGDQATSSIELTREGLNLQIQVLETRFSSVDKQEVGLNLDLEQARADSAVVAVLDQELGIDLEVLEKQLDWYQRRLENLSTERPELQKNLTELNAVVAAVARNKNEISPDQIPAWARREAVLDGGDVLEGLGELRLKLQRGLERNAALRDSFRFEQEVAKLEMRRRTMKREATVASKLREIEKRIGELELERDFVLPVKRSEVRNDIRSKQVQLNSLTPLQQVGGTIVSQKPVRPRGLRATLILVFLGALGGVVLGFSWDYLLANRREIFRS
ncbi:hypothetical protein CSA17_04490 [bacterium DOLJORAL78_65_58]|nr:MAG: hypothetical protein CSA17_04490 [bacterium DOLJORAL78_65_58]